MPSVKNWIGEITKTVGSGDISFGGAIPGFATFSNIPDGQVWYSIVDGNNREAGLGLLASSGTILQRTTIHSTLIDGFYSDNSPGALPLTGNALVYCTFNKEAFDEFANKLPLAGGAMLGALTLFADAANPMEPVTLQQMSLALSGYLQLTGGALTGELVLSGDAANPLNPVSLQQLQAEEYLHKAGGAMTGTLTLASDATNPLEPTTLQQLQAVQDLLGNYLALAGGALTGPLTLSGDATGSLEPATLQQLQAVQNLLGNYLALAGGTMTGALTLAADAVNPLEPVTLQQLEATPGGVVWSVQSTPFTTQHNHGSLLKSTVGTITLHNPADKDYVAFADCDGTLDSSPVTINGNGKLIEGQSSLILDLRGSSCALVYSATTGQWEYLSGTGGVQGNWEKTFPAGSGPFQLPHVPPSRESGILYIGNVPQPTTVGTVDETGLLTITGGASAEVRWLQLGFALPIGTPADGTVTEAKMAPGVIPIVDQVCIVPVGYDVGVDGDPGCPIVEDANLPNPINKNSRVVLANPFGINVPVEALVEVYAGGLWGYPGHYFGSTAIGARGHSVVGEGVVIQTGIDYVVAANAGYGMGAHGSIGGGLTSAPCRIYVRRIKH